MGFEWDQAKAESNLAKHGVDFADASMAFEDPRLFIEADHRHEEPRFKAVGMVAGTILFIAFTRRDNACRPISARRANRRERQEYGQA